MSITTIERVECILKSLLDDDDDEKNLKKKKKINKN